jgi:hypothetical protein
MMKTSFKSGTGGVIGDLKNQSSKIPETISCNPLLPRRTNT